MPITAAQQQDLIKLGVGMFNASVGGYINDLATAVSAGMTTAQLYDTLANSSAFKGLNFAYSSASTNAQFSAYFAGQILGTSVSAANVTAGATYIQSLLDGGQSRGAVMLTAVNFLSASTSLTDTTWGAAAQQFVNKVTVATDYTITKSGTATSIATLQSTIASVTSSAASVTAAISGNTAVTPGTTFTLTTGVDLIVGTSGNDTVIADNTGGTKTLSAADQIDLGAGADTVKVYLAAADTVTGAPTLANTESLYVNGGAIVALDLTAAATAGITSFTSDASLAAANQAFTLGNSQAFTISNFSTAAWSTQLKYGSTATASNVTVNAFGKSTVVEDLDINAGAAVATLNLTDTGAASTMTLTNTAAGLTTLNVLGDQKLTLTTSAAEALAITKIDVSANTAGVTVKDNAALTAAGFTFKGGAGNDTITFANDEFGTLTAGTQLDGGTGTGDKIGLFDTAITAAEAAKINAAVNFEVIGLNAAVTVDASTLTLKQFSLDTNAAQAFTGLATGSKVTLPVAHAATVGVATAVGVSDVSIVVGTSTTAGLAIAGTVTVGATTVALSSLGTNAAANVITTLANADNSVYTVTGSNDLTITNALAATSIGSKIDASALTGKLSVVGNATAFAAASSLGDILIGGSAADTIKASVNNSTLTGNAGNDTFDVSVALGGVTSITTITDFTKGDKITFGATAGAFTATKVDLSGAASVAAALDILAAGSNTDLKWGQFGGNTYIVDDVGAGATFAATDTAVKLIGALDLSTSTFAGTSLTFA